MKQGQDAGGALADLVVVEVAAIISRRRRGGCEISRRGDTDTAEHGPHGELKLHFAAGGRAAEGRCTGDGGMSRDAGLPSVLTLLLDGSSGEKCLYLSPAPSRTSTR